MWHFIAPLCCFNGWNQVSPAVPAWSGVFCYSNIQIQVDSAYAVSVFIPYIDPYRKKESTHRTGSDSVLTDAALPLSWFSSTSLRMFTSSYPVSLSHLPFHPLSSMVTLKHSSLYLVVYLWRLLGETEDGMLCVYMEMLKLQIKHSVFLCAIKGASIQ